MSSYSSVASSAAQTQPLLTLTLFLVSYSTLDIALFLGSALQLCALDAPCSNNLPQRTSNLS